MKNRKIEFMIKSLRRLKRFNKFLQSLTDNTVRVFTKVELLENSVRSFTIETSRQINQLDQTLVKKFPNYDDTQRRIEVIITKLNALDSKEVLLMLGRIDEQNNRSRMTQEGLTTWLGQWREEQRSAFEALQRGTLWQVEADKALTFLAKIMEDAKPHTYITMNNKSIEGYLISDKLHQELEEFFETKPDKELVN